MNRIELEHGAQCSATARACPELLKIARIADLSSSILRILDANLNRAREGLRVWEDYARFGLNHDALCAELKQMRHDLTAAVKRVSADAIHHRDTPGDVGVDNKTAAEGTRASLADIITAAGKRLQEALRTIEEYLKTLDAAAALHVELIRYQSYDVELRLARTLRPGRFDDVRLCVLITESLCRRPWLETAEMAIAGGADCLQLREKNLESGELLSRCRDLVALCRAHDVLCIMNDRPDIAALAGADGVHVGQGDLPCSEIRKIVGDEMIVGVSTHNLDQAKAAELAGADYIGVGPVFPSKTKPRDILPGVDYARAAARAVRIPCIAIAGITVENAAEVFETGVQAIAVSSAVIADENPTTAAKNLLRSAPLQKSRKPVAQTFLYVSPIQPRQPQPAELPQSDSAHLPVGQTFLSASDFQSEPKWERYPRRLPHWRVDGSTYFLTVRIKTGTLSPDERIKVFHHILAGDIKFYSLSGVVVMPDHLHAVLKPNKGIELWRVMKGVKGVTGRIVNQMRNTRGAIWQDESFDRIVRNPEEYIEKLRYIYLNPLRAGIVDDPESYPTTYLSQK